MLGIFKYVIGGLHYRAAYRDTSCAITRLAFE